MHLHFLLVIVGHDLTEDKTFCADYKDASRRPYNVRIP